MSDSKEKEFSETRIRKIPVKNWELFKQYCREESTKRGKTISCNKMLNEVIEVLGSRVEANAKKGDEDSQPELDL